MAWSAPLQICLCCYFMYVELGPAIFAGVAVMIIAIPVNGVIASITRKYQLSQMKNKDHRIKLMNELLNGIKVLKLYGWEPSFIQQILDIRNKEIVVLKKTAWLTSIVAVIWTAIPFIVAVSSFTTYVLIDGGQVLTAQKAFVTMSYLNIIRMPMAMLPFLVIALVQAGVSMQRVNQFMNCSELDEEAVLHDPSESCPIVIKNGSFKWGETDPKVLHDIDLEIERGTLTAVVGTVGSGKSSLISACLGDMVKVNGSVNVVGSMAYVPQQAWMQNASLKDNILFGKHYNSKIYEEIVDACALRPDFEMLPAADQTEIGEKGINLSGGQKQRVSLARAVYSQSDLYLMDDPLSAVDAHVGKHIFDNVVGPDGCLADKTRVLVTHGVTFLPECDKIIVIKEGKVSESGTYKELLEKGGSFAEFLIEYMTDSGDGEDEDEKEELKEALSKSMGAEFQRQISLSIEKKRKDSTASAESVTEKAVHDANLSPIKEKPKSEKPEEVKAGGKLIEKETSETGSVKLDVYFYYFKNLGLCGALTVVTMQILYQLSSLGTNVWLSVWTNETYGDSSVPENRNLYLSVYGGLGLAQALAIMVLSVSLALSTLNASKAMHKRMLEQVMRSPMSFFDTTPIGRIVNRFAKDVDVCDNTLPSNIRQLLSTLTNFIGTICMIIAVVPIFTVVIVPTAIVFFFVQKVYVSCSRQLKRLESISRSPIYSHFGETLSGASTIRAFGMQSSFILQSEKKVDDNQVCYYPSIVANRWLAVMLENLGNIITFAAAMFAVSDQNSIDPSQVGLVISYALNVTAVLNWLVRTTADVETNIVAVERLKEYSEITQEASWGSQQQDKPSNEWPDTGAVTFEKYAMRYRPGLDLVLKNIDAKVNGGEKIGIVGRTGAGKSSLTMALFRLVEPADGYIFIDNKDTSKLGLHDLRTKITIIPQEPVLFSGTLRINLDPFEVYNDDQVWKALEKSHLKEFVSGLAEGLEHPITEGGDNLSVGQRQLICLARALLKKTKILVLDEATAAVDLETDDLIQETIRSEFKDGTVLTIAHRLNTIMDYDRIMVLDSGEIAEFDSVDKLLQDNKTIFHSMVKKAGLLPNTERTE